MHDLIAGVEYGLKERWLLEVWQSEICPLASCWHSNSAIAAYAARSIMVTGGLEFQQMQVKNGSLSAKTAARYNIGLGSLSEVLEGRLLETINSTTVLDYVKLRRATIKNDLTAWSKVMSFAVVKTWATILVTDR